MSAGYPFRSPNAQQASSGYFPSGTAYPSYHPGEGDAYAHQPYDEHHRHQSGASDYYNEGGAYRDDYDARYPTNDYDQAAYANDPCRGHAGHYRTDSQASDVGAVGARDAPAMREADKEMRASYAGGNPPGAAYGFGGPPAAAMGTYDGNSIWSREEKRAFQRRSTIGKILGPIFCVVVLAAICVITAICLIFIFARPPNFALDGATIPVPNIDAANSAFGFNTTIDFSVSNPNSISATVTYLHADITTSDASNVTIGTGELRNEKIAANTNTTISFPLTISLYNPEADPNNLALRSVARQCGWTSGGGSGSVALNIAVTGRISVLSIGVTVPVTTTITPQCPSLSTLQSAIGALSGNSDLGKIIAQVLGGNTARQIGAGALTSLGAYAAGEGAGAAQKVREWGAGAPGAPRADRFPAWISALFDSAGAPLDTSAERQLARLEGQERAEQQQYNQQGSDSIASASPSWLDAWRGERHTQPRQQQPARTWSRAREQWWQAWRRRSAATSVQPRAVEDL